VIDNKNFLSVRNHTRDTGRYSGEVVTLCDDTPGVSLAPPNELSSIFDWVDLYQNDRARTTLNSAMVIKLPPIKGWQNIQIGPAKDPTTNNAKNSDEIALSQHSSVHMHPNIGGIYEVLTPRSEQSFMRVEI